MTEHKGLKIGVRGFCLSLYLLSAVTSSAFAYTLNTSSNNATSPNNQSAVSQDLTLSSGANAVLEKPECITKSGAVLFIHGWAGQKDEVGDLYKDLAKQLSAHCIASLRFDVRGEAEREASNYLLDSTFASRVEDAQSGLDYLQDKYPKLPLVVVGFSLGGATAMELVSEHPDTFDGVVLWSTALNPNEIVTNADTFKEVREALSEGESILKSWADFTLTRKHLVGMLGYNPIRNLGAFKGQMLAIRGSNDYLPAHEKTIFEASNAVREDAYYIGGADHIFNVYEPEKSKKEDVLSLSFKWIIQVLN
ncbi:alpha/beta fold hydrolase [Alteromonas sp. 1_MG-2023]|uniref:alpha/beta hydrolase family protein n=1 Tax=Alteromonas sp. 1_MG-2023 TaxID=3062669 RepID=UPI0026E423B1|nr:alpha/beta fold hydrolase [Alteromonas sp. 1_MG-2023]MDO6567605.1 alpha/beta fold hydrolase [Alteromonas sp. 1_MG-2023]